ncbi:hypothetical protein ACS5PN_17180 [Roseateles sp. NT4]|uniref:hypothetical protein n=1 Tax=Roseateles sp. NT4 TaxID=3453715 RepID=UPI003EEA9C0A
MEVKPVGETLFTYAAVKLVAYAAWSYCGLLIADLGSARPSGLQLLRASLLMGAMRCVFGFCFGIVVALIVRQELGGSFALTYVAVYAPVRFFEWALLAHLSWRAWQDKWSSPRLYLWIVFGIVVSFAADLASPEFVKEGRFCFGRCLC